MSDLPYVRTDRPPPATSKLTTLAHPVFARSTPQSRIQFVEGESKPPYAFVVFFREFCHASQNTMIERYTIKVGMEA